MTPHLPAWFQYLWGGAGATGVFLAVMWTAFFFWPYMKATRAMMQRSLRIGEETAATLAATTAGVGLVTAEVRAAVREIREILGGFTAEDRQRIGRALAALETVPAKLDALSNRGAKGVL
jgi:hypothetical protein